MESDDQKVNTEKISSKFFYIYMVLFVFSGTLVTISNKMLFITTTDYGSFTHIYFLAFITCLGKLSFLLFYYIGEYINKKNATQEGELLTINDPKELNDSTPLKLRYLIKPALCDLASAIFLALGLRFISGSVFRMFTATGVIFTKIFSVFLLKNEVLDINF